MWRWQVLKTTLAVAMLAGFGLSPQLWLHARSYPAVPVWHALPDPPRAVAWAAMGALAGLLVTVIAVPRPRMAMRAFVVVAAVWSLWDQTRWQPWFYQYLVMLAVLGFGPAPDDPERGDASLNACRLVVAGTYFWSGLQKFNVLFVLDVFPSLMDPVLNVLPPGRHADVLGLAWLAALVESAIGLGLLAWPLRPVAVVAAVAMHALILFCLGPWGNVWNSVVWPWNVAMMAFVVTLFGRTRRVRPWHALWPRRSLAGLGTLVLFGVAPLFSFYGRWDPYLSASLYSGNTPDARVWISQDVYDRLPPEVTATYVARLPDGVSGVDECPYEVDLLHWPMGELNVPYYPAERVWRGVARRLAELPGTTPPVTEAATPWGGDARVRVVLAVRGRADWLTAQRKESVVYFVGGRPPAVASDP